MGESLKNGFLTQLTCSQGTDRTRVGIPRCHWLGMSPASNYVLKASAGSPKGARWDGSTLSLGYTSENGQKRGMFLMNFRWASLEVRIFRWWCWYIMYDMYTYVYTYINNIVILHTYLPTDLTCDHLTLPTMFLWPHKSFQSNLEAAASHAKSHTIHFNLWLLAIPSHSPCWRCCLDLKKCHSQKVWVKDSKGIHRYIANLSHLLFEVPSPGTTTIHHFSFFNRDDPLSSIQLAVVPRKWWSQYIGLCCWSFLLHCLLVWFVLLVLLFSILLFVFVFVCVLLGF